MRSQAAGSGGNIENLRVSGMPNKHDAICADKQFIAVLDKMSDVIKN